MKNLLTIIILYVLITLSQAWGLPICTGSPQTEGSIYWDNCVGTYTWEGGNKYVGEWKDYKLHGQGTFTWPTGGKYIGEFYDNKLQGHAMQIWPNGEKYIGQHINPAIPHGQGTFTWPDGSIYIGEWKNGEKNGQGIEYGHDGSKYTGEFKDGSRHKRGTYTWPDGRVWQGQWKNGEWVSGKKYLAGEYNSNSHLSGLPNCPGSPAYEIQTNWNNCVGIYTWSNGGKYTGEYKNNYQHGQGTAIWPNGEKYVGVFLYGKRTGHGTYTWPDGQKYVGEFEDGKKYGQGAYTWPDGEKYVGEFKDKKHGHGIFTYADGSKYLGEWKDGNRHGHGTYTSADGSVWQGQWKNGERVSENKYAEGKNNSPIKENNYIQTIDPNEIVNAASGSGFIVSSSGHIVTNNHVIDGCDDVKVHQKGNTFKATIIEADYMNDLAIIKADITPSIVFSVSGQDAELLQDIYVAGYPFGASISSSIKVTKGIVSSLSGIGNNYSNMQIDAALQPGNSGGPILDNRGNVVGVAVAKLDLSLMLEEFGAVPEDTNFGIKSSILRTFLRANGLKIKNRSDKNISRLELGQKISDGTLFISCWITYAKIEELRTKKVMFENLK